jgi:alpha-ribazole phosphatase
MTELILIRHGETDWNVEGRYQGQSNVPLNEHGREQARRLAAKLRGVQVAAIYSSDLARARETAEILSEATGTPLFLDPRLREIHQGLWEGMLFQDIRRRYAEAFQRRKTDPLKVAPPEGETVGQLRRRVLSALKTILEAYPHNQVAIVSHGLALAIMRVTLNKLPIEHVWDYIPPNAEPQFLTAEVV